MADEYLENLRKRASAPVSQWEAQDHDILAFNYHLANHYAAQEIEARAKSAEQRIAALQNLAGVGGHLVAILHRDQRRGRKTVRIADVLAEAERLHSQSYGEVVDS